MNLMHPYFFASALDLTLRGFSGQLAYMVLGWNLRQALALARLAVENSSRARLHARRAGDGLLADLSRPDPFAGQAGQIAIFPAGAAAARAGDHGRADGNPAAGTADRTAAA